MGIRRAHSRRGRRPSPPSPRGCPEDEAQRRAETREVRRPWPRGSRRPDGRPRAVTHRMADPSSRKPAAAGILFPETTGLGTQEPP